MKKPSEITSSSLEARVSIEYDARWIVQIEAIQAEKHGIRLVEGASCRELAEAAVVIVAMTLRDDEDALVSTDDEPREDPARAEAANSDSVKSDDTTAAEPETRDADTNDRHAGFVRVGALFDVGTLPAPRPGVSAQGGHRWGDWIVDARVSGIFPATTQLSSSNVSGVGGRFFSADALASLCYSPRLGEHVDGSLCAGAGLEALFAEGFGVPDARRSTRFKCVTQAELGVTVHLTRHWSIRPAVAAFLPVGRETYAIENAGTLYTPEVVSLRTSLGIEFDF